MRAPAIDVLMLATIEHVGEVDRCLVPRTVGLELAKWAAELRVRLMPPTTGDRVGVSDLQLRDNQSRALQPFKQVLTDVCPVDPQPPDLSGTL